LSWFLHQSWFRYWGGARLERKQTLLSQDRDTMNIVLNRTLFRGSQFFGIATCCAHFEKWQALSACHVSHTPFLATMIGPTTVDTISTITKNMQEDSLRPWLPHHLCFELHLLSVTYFHYRCRNSHFEEQGPVQKKKETKVSSDKDGTTINYFGMTPSHEFNDELIISRQMRVLPSCWSENRMAEATTRLMGHPVITGYSRW
jgi:hypothetical protein